MVVVFVACIALFLFAMIFAGYVRTVRNKYIGKIRKLRRERMELTNEVQDIRAEMKLRRGRVANLERELEGIRARKAAEQAAAMDTKAPARTVVDALKYMGKVTDADLEKAKSYLEKTKSESTIEQALVILELVSAADVSAAAAEVSG